MQRTINFDNGVRVGGNGMKALRKATTAFGNKRFDVIGSTTPERLNMNSPRWQPGVANHGLFFQPRTGLNSGVNADSGWASEKNENVLWPVSRVEMRSDTNRICGRCSTPFGVGGPLTSVTPGFTGGYSKFDPSGVAAPTTNRHFNHPWCDAPLCEASSPRTRNLSPLATQTAKQIANAKRKQRLTFTGSSLLFKLEKTLKITIATHCVQPLLLLTITFTFLTASLHAQNINRPTKMAPMGLQVNTATGNVFLGRTDVHIPARQLDIDVSFAYNTANYTRNSGYGSGWTFEYNIRYRLDTIGRVILIWGNGREDAYTPVSGGWKAPTGFFDSLSHYQPGKYRLRQTDGLTYLFDNATHKRLTKITEPNGNYLQFGYTDSLLTSITNAAGQTVSLTYSTGRLTSVSDANASPTQTYTYTYDAYGNLTKVTDPVGGTYKYTYLVNGPMSSITDKNDNVANVVYYAGFAAREIISCNSRVGFSYDTTTHTTTAIDFMENGANQTSTYTYNEKGWLKTFNGACCGYKMEFGYDNSGNLLTRKDGNGNVWTYTYDNRGNAISITDPLNNVTTLNYTTDFNQIAGLVDPMGNVYAATYDAAGNPLQVTRPGGSTFTSTYAANGDLLTEKDGNNNLTIYQYDAYGYPMKLTASLNLQEQLTFDGRGNFISGKDGNGANYALLYDSLNRLKQITDGLNRNTKMNYDKAGNLTMLTDAKGFTQTMSYDASDRVVKYKDAGGDAFTMAYDAANNPVRFTDALGNATTFGYDAQARLASITDALGNGYTFSYDAAGNTVSTKMPNGNTATYTYDAANRPLGSSDGAGGLGTLTYDKNGNVTAYTNAAGATLSLTYDNLNRMTKMTDPLGNTRVFTYDNNDNLLTQKDRNNHVSSYAYNALNRSVSFTDANNNVRSVAYDSVGNVTQANDQNGAITRFEYDAAARPFKTIYPDGSYVQLTYDDNDNITATRLADGSVVTYAYDSADRLIAKTLPDGDAYAYTYDRNGRLLSATNNAGTVTYSYDAAGRTTSETLNSHTTAYDRNTAARRVTTTYPNGTTVTRNYDLRGRLISLQTDGRPTATYSYNGINQVLQKSYGNGVVTAYQYDGMNRLKALSSNNAVLPSLGFQYDGEGNKTVVQRLNDPQYSETFAYDASYRLTAYKQGVLSGTAIPSPLLQNTYTYDAVGNRAAASLNGVNATYALNNLNQYTAVNGTAYTYDGRGNRTYDGTFHMRYDAQGRKLMDSTAGMVLRYGYDALGRRVAKTMNGTPVNYYYAGLQQIEERNAADSTVGTQVFEARFVPLMRTTAAKRYFQHLNDLNSTEAATDSTGALLERYKYEDFGKTTVLDAQGAAIASSAINNRLLYTGQEYDAQSKNYHFYFRSYDPATGSFAQRDPIGYADQMGLYQYVGNNPANMIDPLGLAPCPPGTQSRLEQIDQERIDRLSHTSNYLTVITEILRRMQAETSKYNINLGKDKRYGKASNVLNLANLLNKAENLRQNINNMSEKDAQVEVAEIEMATLGIANDMGLTQKVLTPVVGPVAAKGASRGVSTIVAVDALAQEVTGHSLSYHYAHLSDGAEQLGRDLAEHNNRRVDARLDFLKKYIDAATKLHGYDRSKWTDEARENYKKYFNLRKMLNYRDDCPPNGDNGNQNPLPGPPGQGGRAEVVYDKDPNAIIGPDGVGEKRWVSVHDPLPYTILFENAKEATAPVKVAKIYCPLDPKHDINTFQLGGFGFNNLTFTVPSNTNAYYKRLDVKDSLGIYVDVTAGIDAVSKQAFWIFESIDPTTLLPVTDPLKGFLLTYDSSNVTSGHGYVDFSIKPVSNAATGDTTSPFADIVFGTNDTIPTNRHKNTIDALPPASNLATLPAVTPNTEIDLHLSGSDDAGGSGLKWHSVYVSDNGRTLQLYVDKFGKSDTTFRGVAKHTYQFYIAATDSVGNKETPKLAGTVRITDGEEIICPGGNITFVATAGGASYQWQVDNGTGYSNIAEGGIYSGPTSATLTLTGAPTSLYGYRYRAVINGNTYSTEYLLKFGMTWEGTVSTAWENSANWSCGLLPDANTDVKVPGEKVRYPLVNMSTSVRSLATQNGAVVTVRPGATLTVVK